MANFCHQCAATLTPAMKVCPNCGTRVIAQERFTAQRVSEQRVAAPPRPSPAYRPRAFDPPAPLERYDPALPFPGVREHRYPKASIGARIAAWLIDAFVQLACWLPGAVGIGLAAGAHNALMGVLGGTALALGGIYSTWYYFTRDGRPGGAGIGKRRMGLMVVHLPTNTPATRGQSALRGLVSALVHLVPFVGTLLEPAVMIATDDGRRVADFAADTQVIAVEDYANLDMPDE